MLPDSNDDKGSLQGRRGLPSKGEASSRGVMTLAGGGKGGGGKGGKGGGSIQITGDSGKPVSFDLAGGVTMTTDIGGTGTPIETRTEMGGTGTPMETRTDIGGTGTPLVTRAEMGGTGTPLATSVSIAVPDPIRTDSTNRTELAVPEPIRTASDMRLDVKPVVLDLCLTAGIGKVPRLSITRPYEHHLSLRAFGLELFGLDLHGQHRMVVDDLPPRPAVVWGKVSAERETWAARGPTRPAGPLTGFPGMPGDERDGPPSAGGLRIRLDD